MLKKFLVKLWKDERGAVTIAAVLAGSYMNISSVIASADADTTATITHGLVGTPLIGICSPVLSQALTALSAWTVAVGASTTVCTKLTSTGSGSASIQALVLSWLPHTSIR